MSRRLTTLFLSMLILTGAMGLKTVVMAHNDGAILMANGSAPVPPDSRNGSAPLPPDSRNGSAPLPPDSRNGSAPLPPDSRNGSAPLPPDSRF